MKQNLKRILPILLAIIVIFSVVWYLFVYDRDFTRDMLIQQARHFEDQGNRTLAVWLYNQAYIQSGEDDDVAIELAERFKAIGDYTKAERTLTNAIKDGGSLDLYIALCKTYVEQDKLKDAVTMLNNVTDPEIEAQLKVLRPQAPTASHDSGTFDQYVTVTVEAPNGKLYLTSDGSYPTLNSNVSTGSIDLVGGKNELYALAIDENGLISPLSYFSYTVSGVIEQIVLSDSALHDLSRELLQLEADEPLYTNDLWQLTALTIPGDAKSSTDLRYMPYLETLTAENSSISSWSSISSLTHLKEIHFKNCTVTAEDLAAIGSLPKLEKLTLSGCMLTDIEGLANAKQLTYLDLSNNAIRDLTALSFMSGLQTLDLDHNALENLSAISSLANLQTLDVSHNSLASATPLASCTRLTTLDVSNNLIAALSGMDTLTELTALNASYNKLTDISKLSNCTKLTELNISNNTVSDISALSGLNALQTLNFSRNSVEKLPKWSATCALVTIDGSYNKVKEIESLAGFENLNNILMDYNKITAVNKLTACRNLAKVSVYGNPVKDVSKLKDLGIIVNYTPKT